MEDLEEVRRRISQKKQAPVLNNHSFNRFYKGAISFMLTVALVLAAGCVTKLYPEINVIDYVDTHILSLLPSLKFEKKLEVNQIVAYQKINQNQYISNDANVYALEDGIVIESENFQITILYDNGITASYKQLATCSVEKNDRITRNEKLATYENYFEMILNKDGVEIQYEEFDS